MKEYFATLQSISSWLKINLVARIFLPHGDNHLHNAATIFNEILLFRFLFYRQQTV